MPKVKLQLSKQLSKKEIREPEILNIKEDLGQKSKFTPKIGSS
jgi:hypothetical protein